MNHDRRLIFRAEQAWGDLLLSWWRGLAEDSGGRAALRRAPDLTAVVLQPSFQRLYQRLRRAGWPGDARAADRLAAVAGLLSHITEADENPLPIAMSRLSSDKPVVSPLRFKRLLESPDINALFTGIRRALPLVAYRCDPLGLATDVVNWGDAVRKQWAYRYEWPDKDQG